jgi:DNA (cytosine-5)-methyltransferase 1
MNRLHCPHGDTVVGDLSVLGRARLPLTYGSVCSGIEAASVAWEPLGMRASWFAEIEPFPSAVLARHWPETPNLGDMTKIAERVTAREIDAPDVLVGGTPCQAFSVAGLRKSLEDSRGQLSLAYCRLANAIDDVRRARGLPEAVIVWENVPGVLSTKDNAFGCFLAGLAGEVDALIPPGGKWSNAGAVFGPTRTVCWRILDAQYFGVAQRRRRVFVVASARKGFDPCAVLFESKGVRRDSPPSREAREEVTGTISARTQGGGGLGTDFDLAGGIQVFGGNNTGGAIEVGPALNAKGGSGRMDFESEALCVTGDRTHALKAEGADASEDGTGRGTPIIVHGTQDPGISEIGHTLGRNTGQENALLSGVLVRRLTPTECERLQGFPDGSTLVPYRGKPAADGPRYRALGNSMAVPVMRWIGRRLLRELEVA